ncbi:serine acetyltransferase [Methylobacterium sp. WL103]|uniref:serine O-acetyltransferase n=1 Tax=unclassified Methylobacterium TaxID=2615210 RepID=UPI0011CA228F|nr:MULTISPECIES: serine acetyltransferase [unclassified Methylobacterium]TXM66904.1 serine acetyltransferase [Methylobacterium sp. WL12]TXN05808.1 serine acetyltransferase [Methylobacterium sp. WL103]
MLPGSKPSWSDVAAALRADRQHWARHGHAYPRLNRGYHAILLHRLSRFAHERGWREAAWFLWLVNHAWTKADLPPSTRIGGGLFLPHPAGIVIAGAVGKNVTLGMLVGIGGLYKKPEGDIGGGPGLPVIGDDVVIEARVLVLGPVKVGDRAWIKPRSFIRQDVEADHEVSIEA